MRDWTTFRLDAEGCARKRDELILMSRKEWSREEGGGRWGHGIQLGLPSSWESLLDYYIPLKQK